MRSCLLSSKAGTLLRHGQTVTQALWKEQGCLCPLVNLECIMRHVRQSWRSPAHLRPSVVRRVWLWSGLVLFTYVVTHLANHALGLISLEAMETGRSWFLLRVAPPRWHCRPLRCAQCSYRAGAGVALPAPSLPPPTLGSTATPARAEHPAAPRDAYSRDPSVARLVQTPLTRTRVWSCSIGSSAQTSA